MIHAREARIVVGTRTLLDDLTFSINPGEFVAVLGPNGVGKTTLLRALGGSHPTKHGTISVGGQDVFALGVRERARRIAVVTSDDAPLDDVSVAEVVSTGRYAFHEWWQWNPTPADHAAVRDALAAVGMSGFADRMFATLSSGERQRIWIALALAQEAPVLLLDEPTSHLDVRVAHDILRLLRARSRSGKTIVCAIHDINDAAAYADRLMLLGAGRMLDFDEPDRILAGPSIDRAYDVKMETVRTLEGAVRVFPSPPQHR